MEGYLKPEDLKEGGCCQGIISEADLDSLSDPGIATMTLAAKELIDGYCGKKFEGEVPALVKIASAQLMVIFLSDMSKTGESVESYSYSNDPDAFSNVLNILKFLPDEKNESAAAKARRVKAKVI